MMAEYIERNEVIRIIRECVPENFRRVAETYVTLLPVADAMPINDIETYPVTIIEDRYTGAYSGGEWTAWPCDADEIPDDVWADDVSCYMKWDELIDKPIGRGATPNLALRDLANRLRTAEAV